MEKLGMDFLKIRHGFFKGTTRGFPYAINKCWWNREAKASMLKSIQQPGDIIYVGFTLSDLKRSDAKAFKSNKVTFKFPLIEWGMTNEDSFKYLKEKGIVHPLRNFHRTGCWLCPKQSLHSLSILHKEYPELWKKLKKYEKDSPHGFHSVYTLKQLEKRFKNKNIEHKQHFKRISLFHSNKDQYMEDEQRRLQGAFFTPLPWVNQAHDTITSVLGPFWQDRYLVWDPAAGTGNLTRDYSFKDLIISTAEKEDIEIIQKARYNPEAITFQYDFLNPGVASPFLPDGVKNNLPRFVRSKLKQSAEDGQTLLFFMNPPYATANVRTNMKQDTKIISRAGIAKTKVNFLMKDAVITGSASQQLYAQFLFRCNQIATKYKFNNHYIALFCNPRFMTSGPYASFREWWYKQYSLKSIFLLPSSEFSGLQHSRWAISFTIWKSPGTTPLNIPIKAKILENNS
jgi:hypothetical protein